MGDGKNKRFYWLKLTEDFFRQKEIKKLRKIAGGDTFTIIYLKMLLRSIEDGGKLYYEGLENDFASELALDIDEDEDNVKVTVQFLLASGILQENTASEYEMLTAKEMVGSEGSSAKRMRKMRAAKAIANRDMKLLSQSDGYVTKSDTDIDIEKDIDTDTEIDNDEEEERGRARDTDNPYVDSTTQGEQEKPDTVERYAVNNLQCMSERAMSELASFKDDLPEDVIRHGIDNALDKAVRNWSYVRAILNSYAEANVRTVGEAKALDEQRSKKNANGSPPASTFGIDRRNNKVPRQIGKGIVL